eukprot:747711-Hanusia_phi.AAC.2
MPGSGARQETASGAHYRGKISQMSSEVRDDNPYRFAAALRPPHAQRALQPTDGAQVHGYREELRGRACGWRGRA